MLTIVSDVAYMINKIVNWYFFFNEKNYKNYITPKKRNPKPKTSFLFFSFLFSLIRLDRTYFAETENWKYCSKIIFKCVNSTMRPIFNEKLLKSEICESYE